MLLAELLPELAANWWKSVSDRDETFAAKLDSMPISRGKLTAIAALARLNGYDLPRERQQEQR